MNLVNLTPHAIVVRLANGDDMTFQATGAVARVSSIVEPAGDVCGVPTRRIRYGETVGLPVASPDTIYIVSGMVRAANAARTDLASPDTGSDAIRDANGQIVAVRALLVS